MRNRVIRNLKVLSISLMMAIAGCVAVGQLDLLQKLGLTSELPIYKIRPIKFSHEVHGEKEDLACDGCHTKALDSDEAGMPSVRACRQCHDSEEDLNEKLRPFAVDQKVMWTDATAISADVKFSHKVHHDAKIACADCHKGILQSEAVSADLKVNKDDCLSCHARENVSGDCQTCHQEINRDWQPPSHEKGWDRFHGQVARAGIDPPYENRCSLCHQDSACSTCHQDTEPENHNNQWRERGHGIHARMDRENCAVCHRTDFCDRCHRETEPRSHRAGWGSPYQRHCLTCHVPLASEGCAACHERLESHLAAPDRPDNITHDTASESACRTCHALAFMHPDNGDSCRSCHY